jgi:hypothetical protein
MEDKKLPTNPLRMLIALPLLLAGLGLACSTENGTRNIS